MSPTQNYDSTYRYYCSPSPPSKVAPPHHPIPGTQPSAAAPPRHFFPSPAVPPPHSFQPPRPPHINPTPAPAPSPSPPGNHTSVIVIVFVSLGGLFFLAFLSVALCCFLKKKKNKGKMVQETEIVNVEEHLKVHEAIVPGPHGEQTVILSIDDDIKIQEEIKKSQIVAQSAHSRSMESPPRALDIGDDSCSTSNQESLEHKA